MSRSMGRIVHLELEVDCVAGHFLIPLRLEGKFERGYAATREEPADGPEFDPKTTEWKLPGAEAWTPIPEGFLPERIFGGLCDEAARILEEDRLSGPQEE